MFQKVSLLVSVSQQFSAYDSISVEIVLQRSDTKTILNSGFMQSTNSQETRTQSLELENLQRKQMLSAMWWKGKNEQQVCLFEFLDKGYEACEIKVQTTYNNRTTTEQIIQPLEEGTYSKATIEYTIKRSDLSA